MLVLRVRESRGSGGALHGACGLAGTLQVLQRVETGVVVRQARWRSDRS